MTDIQKFATQIQDKPCHIHYYDNGEWMLVDAEAWFAVQATGEDIEEEAIIMQGGETEGYMPDIVAALCIALNQKGVVITADSI